MPAVASRPQSIANRQPARPAQGTCRLTIRINGVNYTVRPNRGRGFAAIKAYRLRKPNGTVYDVVQTVTGIECDRPDHVFHRDGIDPGGCKHVKAVVACGLLTR
jgi:hypothetical protein